MKKILLLTALVLTIVIATNAQEKTPYKATIGARLGVLTGFTYKTFVNDNFALEGVVGSRLFNNTMVAGLVQYHFTQITEVTELGIYPYVGGGIHLGYGYGYVGSRGWGTTYVAPYPVVGIDAVVGAEYKFEDAPFTVGVDVMPFFDFINFFPGFYSIGVTGRYIFK